MEASLKIVFDSGYAFSDVWGNIFNAGYDSSVPLKKTEHPWKSSLQVPQVFRPVVKFGCSESYNQVALIWKWYENMGRLIFMLVWYVIEVWYSSHLFSVMVWYEDRIELKLMISIEVIASYDGMQRIGPDWSVFVTFFSAQVYIYILSTCTYLYVWVHM